MSIQTVTGGTLPTPIIEWVTQSVTRDESYTPEYNHSMILNAAQIATLRPAQDATYGMSGHTITEIGRPTYLWPDAYRVFVTTIDRPEGYENQILVSAQFLPSYLISNATSAELTTIQQTSRPFTADTDGREVVTFVPRSSSNLLAAVVTPQPTFKGQPVNFYGVVISPQGRILGETVPKFPPTEIIVDRRIDKWRPGWLRMTVVYARRPAGV